MLNFKFVCLFSWLVLEHGNSRMETTLTDLVRQTVWISLIQNSKETFDIWKHDILTFHSLVHSANYVSFMLQILICYIVNIKASKKTSVGWTDLSYFLFGWYHKLRILLCSIDDIHNDFLKPAPISNLYERKKMVLWRQHTFSPSISRNCVKWVYRSVSATVYFLLHFKYVCEFWTFLGR